MEIMIKIISIENTNHNEFMPQARDHKLQAINKSLMKSHHF